MLLSNCILTRIVFATIYKPCGFINGELLCKNNKKFGISNWLTRYLRVIGNLYDIVSRAIMTHTRMYRSIARTNIQKNDIKIGILSTFARFNAIIVAIVLFNSCFYAYLLCCHKLINILNLEGGDVYD